MPTVIYHNPRCSTSRNALAMLREAGLEPEVACRAGFSPLGR